MTSYRHIGPRERAPAHRPRSHPPGTAIRSQPIELEDHGMRRRAFILGAAAVLPLAMGMVTRLGAAEIRKDSTAQVNPNSIWFQDAAKFAHWRALKTSGDSAALEAYQQKALAARDAWQFTTQLSVKVLSYATGKNRVRVELMTPGRCSAPSGTWIATPFRHSGADVEARFEPGCRRRRVSRDVCVSSASCRMPTLRPARRLHAETAPQQTCVCVAVSDRNEASRRI
jgi:hypothetical protein